MKPIVFACDLDNTLIFSSRYRREGDFCVEWIHEKEQGYLPASSVPLLRRICEAVTFLPITTRSIEQYRRICWPEGCEPALAITTNGAVLLRDGEPDAAWQEESARLCAPYREELERMLAYLSATDLFLRCRIVDSMYLFSYCKDTVDAKECAARYSAMTSLSVIASGKKIYFFPPAFHKGEALRRFLGGRVPELLIAAGDSAIDIPMLEMADLALLPVGFPTGAYREKRNLLCPGVMRFPEFVPRAVLAEIGSSVD